MWNKFWNCFVKVTGWLPYLLCYRTRIYYEDPAVQRRRIRGAAIVISNHTSLFDYVAWLFVFLSRTVRFQMAELLFRKPLLGILLRCLGGIYVNRDARDFSFVAKSEEILRRGGVVGIFPESRLPRSEEARPLPFKPSAAYLALSTGVPVIPVYTNGSYFSRKRARVIIGVPMNPAELERPELSYRENIARVADAMRTRIMELESKLNEQIQREADETAHL